MLYMNRAQQNWVLLLLYKPGNTRRLNSHWHVRLAGIEVDAQHARIAEGDTIGDNLKKWR